MSLFGKTVRECVASVRFLRPAFLMLAVLGVFRVFIGAIGVPQSVGTWISSGTLLAMMLAVYYGYSAPSHGFSRLWQFILIGQKPTYLLFLSQIDWLLYKLELMQKLLETQYDLVF